MFYSVKMHERSWIWFGRTAGKSAVRGVLTRARNLRPYEGAGSKYSRGMPRQHRVETGLFRALGQQRLDPGPLFRIVERIRPPQMLPGSVMRDGNGDVVRGLIALVEGSGVLFSCWGMSIDGNQRGTLH